MDLSDAARDLCKEYGGFWKFVEKGRFTIDFLIKYHDEIQDIIHEVKEYNFIKYELEECYLGKNGEPPRYDFKTIKDVLRENNIKTPKKATEERVRKYAYTFFITKLRKDLESYL